MRHDERYRSGSLALGVEEVNLFLSRLEAVVRKYRQSVQLGLPIEIFAPVTAEIS